MADAKRPSADWEAIEREYRAGQLSVSEIGRLHGVSHTAINKRAKKEEWARDLSSRVREAVSARLVSEEVSIATEVAAIDLAAARGVKIIREHQSSIGRGQKLVNLLFEEMEQATTSISEIEDEIEIETANDKNTQRRTIMLKAVALPTRASTLSSLSAALKTLVGLERQAFNLDAPVLGADASQSDVPNEARRKAALALLLAKQ